MRALWNKLESLSDCDVFINNKLEQFDVDEGGVSVKLGDGMQLQTDLLIGADGSNSNIRQLAGIGHYGWEYQQKALVATVKPERSHQNTAWQRFLPEGPLALLPLRDGLVSIVWTSKTETTEAYLALDEAEFCRELTEASDNQLGEFSLVGERGAFPLKMQFSSDYCDQRVVLLGDAIHTIHPLAGQGANLGLKDAVGLAEVVLKAHSSGRDIASQQVLKRYERIRKGDNLLMMGVMDGLKRLFGADDQFVQLARSTGMGLINNSVLIKNRICKYAMGL